jgi:succinate dehydrogenase / fumarate reductase, cytochrome b subunit
MNALTRSATAYWQSSIGKKLIVAVTGVVMVLFLAGHLTGNLLIFAGREAFNDYAQFLHEAGHGALIWVARVGLLVTVVLHVIATIQLTRQNRAARSEAYQYKTVIQAKKSSRLMIWSGLTILAFIVFHILHFTVKIAGGFSEMIDKDYLKATGESRHDAYGMVIAGFQNCCINWVVVAFYIIAMTLLCSHLSHGVGSVFQTLGWRSQKSQELIRKISLGYSYIIWAGFISVPLSIFFGFVK